MIDLNIIKELKQNDVAENPEKVKARLRELWKQNMHKRDEILAIAGIKKITVERSYKKGAISAKLASAMASVLNINPFYLIGAVDEPGVCTNEMLVKFLIDHGYEKMIENIGKPKRKYTTRKTVAANAVNTDINELPDFGYGKHIEIDNEQDKLKESDWLDDMEPEDNKMNQEIGEIAEDEIAEDEIAEDNESVDEREPIVAKLISNIELPTTNERAYLEALTEEDINLLLKGLILRSRYFEDAKIILDLVKTLLIG